MEYKLLMLFRLLLAHILSDFLFQTDKMSLYKCAKGSGKVKYILLHAAIHAVTTYMILGDWNGFLLPCLIFVSHFLIDLCKSYSKLEKITLFFVDQVAHLSIILILWICFYESKLLVYNFLHAIFVDYRIFVIIISYLVVLKPASIFLNLFFQHINSNVEKKGMRNAGKWIGYIERVLILTFILIDRVEAVGFLLAAKSIFRFGELKNNRELITTEYVLIGTLASFVIAVIVGLISKNML